MEKMNQNKKISNIGIGMVMLVSLLLVLMAGEVNAVEAIENTNLDEIFEVYNNTDLEEGMVLAPNPFANEEENSTQDLQEIFDMYNDADLKEGQVLSPAPSINMNPTSMIVTVGLVAIVMVGVVVGLKRKNAR